MGVLHFINNDSCFRVKMKTRTYSSVSAVLTLMPEGTLYGAGWDLSLPYGADYDPAAALASPQLKIAEGVISAAAGYNYGLYVTEDGALHFIGSSGIPFGGAIMKMRPRAHKRRKTV